MPFQTVKEKIFVKLNQTFCVVFSRLAAWWNVKEVEEFEMYDI